MKPALQFDSRRSAEAVADILRLSKIPHAVENVRRGASYPDWVDAAQGGALLLIDEPDWDRGMKLIQSALADQSD